MTLKTGQIPWNKGRKGLYKYSEEQKKRKSEELKKIWESGKRDRNEWGKIMEGNQYALGKHWKYPHPFSESHRKKLSEINKGKKCPWVSKLNKDRIVSIDTCIKRSRSLKRVYQEGRHPNWKGGITPENQRIRRSIEFRQWRKAVFIKDNYTCWICEEKGGTLHPHHLKSFSKYIELRFDVNNGLTLCEFCHKTYTKFYE